MGTTCHASVKLKLNRSPAYDGGLFLWRNEMTKLPEKNVLTGNKTPATTTGEMKGALGKLRDYLNDLLGEDSADKEGARLALGVDLTGLTNRIESKADLQAIETAILSKADRTELNDKAQELEEAIAKRGTPVGSIEYFAMATPPWGYLIANGAAVGRSTYPGLFDAIGTMFGEGDGETTFNLPDLMDRFAQGSTTPGKKVEAGLPNIEGYTVSGLQYPTGFGGAMYSRGYVGAKAPGADNSGTSLGFDASLSNPIYGASDTVQPPALTLLPCIKAFDAATHPGLIDMSALANDVADLSANKLDKTVNGNAVRYIAEAFSDGTNWYRKWSDGWIEQGGAVGTSNSVTLQIPFKDTDYFVIVVWAGGKSAVFYASDAQTRADTTTTFYTTMTSNGGNVKGNKWYACGMGTNP